MRHHTCATLLLHSPHAVSPLLAAAAVATAMRSLATTPVQADGRQSGASVRVSMSWRALHARAGGLALLRGARGRALGGHTYRSRCMQPPIRTRGTASRTRPRSPVRRRGTRCRMSACTAGSAAGPASAPVSRRRAGLPARLRPRVCANAHQRALARACCAHAQAAGAAGAARKVLYRQRGTCGCACCCEQTAHWPSFSASVSAASDPISLAQT